MAALELALRGGDPKLGSFWAADRLAHHPNGVRLLVRIINSTEPPELRHAAVYGLTWGAQKAPVITLLRHVFMNTRELPVIRGQAAEALAGRWKPRWLNWQRRHIELADALLRGLDAPEVEVRFWSIFALAQQGNDWLIPKLRTMTSDEALCPRMWTIRQEALWAIRWIESGDIDCEPHTL